MIRYILGSEGGVAVAAGGLVGVGVGIGSTIDTWRQVVVGAFDSVTPVTENDRPYNPRKKEVAWSNGLRSVPARSPHVSSL
jgi:hypothetical protein